MEQPSKRLKVLQNCRYRALGGHPILGISSPPFPDTTNFPGLASPSFLNLFMLWSKTLIPHLSSNAELYVGQGELEEDRNFPNPTQQFREAAQFHRASISHGKNPCAGTCGSFSHSQQARSTTILHLETQNTDVASWTQNNPKLGAS